MLIGDGRQKQNPRVIGKLFSSPINLRLRCAKNQGRLQHIMTDVLPSIYILWTGQLIKTNPTLLCFILIYDG